MNDMKRVKPVKSGKGIRMSYAKQREVLDMPNLIEVQKNSYQWFLDAGLKEVFDDTSLTVTMILALKLMECGKTNVDYEIVWDEAHGRADYPGEMVEWVRSIYAV